MYEAKDFEILYGAVRRVRGMRIVTRFWMFKFVPIVPLGSLYVGKARHNASSSVPLAAFETLGTGIIVPLRQLHMLSVLIGYLRAIVAAPMVVSAILVFCFFFNPAPMSAKADVVLAISTAFFLLTYLVTFHVPARERHIREACNRVLGLAVDPAKVSGEFAAEICKAMDVYLAEKGISDLRQVIERPHACNRDILNAALVRMRAEHAPRETLEAQEILTDQLLQAIRLLSGR